MIAIDFVLIIFLFLFQCQTNTLSNKMYLILYTEATCARGETLTRLLDYHVQKALCARHPLIARLLPQDANTILLEYVIQIYEECTEELKDHMSHLAGDVNVSFDGVTVNGKSKMVYTVSKNEFS